MNNILGPESEDLYHVKLRNHPKNDPLRVLQHDYNDDCNNNNIVDSHHDNRDHDDKDEDTDKELYLKINIDYDNYMTEKVDR